MYGTFFTNYSRLVQKQEWVQKIWYDFTFYLRHLPCLTAIIALKIIQITLVIVSARYLPIIKDSNFGILLCVYGCQGKTWH